MKWFYFESLQALIAKLASTAPNLVHILFVQHYRTTYGVCVNDPGANKHSFFFGTACLWHSQLPYILTLGTLNKHSSVTLQ